MDILIYVLVGIAVLSFLYLMFSSKDRFDDPSCEENTNMPNARKDKIRKIAKRYLSNLNKEVKKEVKKEEKKEEIVVTDYDNELLVSSSPHVFSNVTTRKIMKDVVIALLPATIVSFVFFGLNIFLFLQLTLF